MSFGHVMATACAQTITLLYIYLCVWGLNLRLNNVNYFCWYFSSSANHHILILNLWNTIQLKYHNQWVSYLWYLLGSIDSVFSLQSIPSVYMTTSRWKHIDISLQNALVLFIIPWLIYLCQLKTLLTSWRRFQVLLPSLLKNDLFFLMSLYKYSIGLLFCFFR